MVAKSNRALAQATWTLMLDKNGTAAVFLNGKLLRTDLSMSLAQQQTLVQSNKPSPITLGIFNFRSEMKVTHLALATGAMPEFALPRNLSEPAASLEWTSQAGCAVLRTPNATSAVPEVISPNGQLPVIELVDGQELHGLITLHNSTAVTVMLSVHLMKGLPSSLKWSLGEETVTLVADGAQSSVLLSWRSESTAAVVPVPQGNWTVLVWVETGTECQLWVDGNLRHVFSGGRRPLWANRSFASTFTINSESTAVQLVDAIAVYTQPLPPPALLHGSQALKSRRSNWLQAASAGVCGSGQAIDLSQLATTTFVASSERDAGLASSVAEPEAPPWLSGQNAPAWIEADFGIRKVLILIRALLMQQMAGKAVHHVILDGQSIHTWTSSAGAQWLQLVPRAGSTAQRVRIMTVVSPGEVGWYQIELRGCPQTAGAVFDQVLPGVKSSLKLRGLATGTTYNATVTALNKAGAASPVHLSFRTASEPAQPAAPQWQLSGKRFAGTVQLTWKTPQSDLEIIGYRVLVQSKVHFLEEIRDEEERPIGQKPAPPKAHPWTAQVVQTAGPRTNTALTLPVYTPDGGVLMYQFAVQAISTVGHGRPSAWSEWVSKLSPRQMNELFPPMVAEPAMHLNLAESELHPALLN
jgi:hypothetical protein